MPCGFKSRPEHHFSNLPLLLLLSLHLPNFSPAGCPCFNCPRPVSSSLGSLAKVPWSQPAQRILEKRVLPSAEEKIAMLVHSVNHFLDAGYHHIGMEHFTKPDDPLAVAQRNKTLQRNFKDIAFSRILKYAASGCRPTAKRAAPIGRISRSWILTMSILMRIVARLRKAS